MAILRAIQGSRHHPSLQPLWDEVRTRYGELNLAEQAEEVMALAAEQTRPAIKRWWDALLSKLWAALKRLGWFPSTVRRSELLHLIDTLEQRIANKSARPNTVSSEVMFSRTKSASFEAALNATTLNADSKESSATSDTPQNRRLGE
ncbi:hypothetical protein [Vibrio penaeicida]|uniref:hypothetical protein n=1 Tax=Vibrio penaeicida TaxID=104609 RepID=UPI001CC8021E|nr:hypothetical protein [Vibrio penaeicida]